MGKDKVSYIYMLRCSDHTFYIGWTDDLVQRIRAHNSGRGAKYTRGKGPVQLVYWEKYPNKRQAMRREYALKQWTRAEKMLLIGAEEDNEKF